jgi:hypothetical protein
VRCMARASSIIALNLMKWGKNKLGYRLESNQINTLWNLKLSTSKDRSVPLHLLALPPNKQTAKLLNVSIMPDLAAGKDYVLEHWQTGQLQL